MSDERHCKPCICGRRAPVMKSSTRANIGPGTISWDEHLRVWSAYANKYGERQSAERMVERGGFWYDEVVYFLGHEPETWQPR